MTGPRTPEVRRAEAEHRLIAAAADLVGELGPSKVTLANVGQRAGYSRGLATHHFGSKGALMQRLVEAVTHQFRDAMFDRGGADDLVAELRTLIGLYFDVVTDREFREEIEKRIIVGVTAGQVPSTVHPHGLATVIVAMLRGVALQSRIDDHVDLEGARSEVEALLVHRLTTEQKAGHR